MGYKAEGQVAESGRHHLCRPAGGWGGWLLYDSQAHSAGILQGIFRAGLAARPIKDPDARLHKYLEERYGPMSDADNRQKAFLDYFNVDHIKALQLMVKHDPEAQHPGSVATSGAFDGRLSRVPHTPGARRLACANSKPRGRRDASACDAGTIHRMCVIAVRPHPSSPSCSILSPASKHNETDPIIPSRVPTNKC